MEKLKILISSFFNIEKNKYDLILFDIGSNNNPDINQLIYKISDVNILLTEGNLIGVNKFKNYLEKNNLSNNFYIVINKKDEYCIDEKILSKIFNFQILGFIRYEAIYSNLVNKNFNLLNSKNKYQKEYQRIYKNIERCKETILK